MAYPQAQLRVGRIHVCVCMCVCMRVCVCVCVCVCRGVRTWKKVHVAESLIPSVPSLCLTQRKKKCTGCLGVSRWKEATAV